MIRLCPVAKVFDVAARVFFPLVLALFQESSLLACEGIACPLACPSRTGWRQVRASTGKKRRSRNDIWLRLEAALCYCQ
jgi:hypothetical protein